MKKYKRLMIAVSILLALIISLLGGVKLLIYVLILLTGIFVGAKYTGFKRMYDDYKLALKVNTVMYNSKESEVQKSQLEQLNRDLAMANERIKLYSSAMVTTKPMNIQMRGEYQNDNQPSNGSSRLRENELFNREGRSS